MTRIIMKSPYFKPGGKHAINLVKYIATREGVDKSDDSWKWKPTTYNQKNLIKLILRDFPDSTDMFEYEDYIKNGTRGNATEFITRSLEEHADKITGRKTYVNYIATRPGVEKLGTHGLFTDSDIPVELPQVIGEIGSHGGNIWSHIVSLRREDAERLGFDNAARWKALLRSHAETIATNMKIDLENFRWFAAYHDESHHPHIHMVAYSVDPKEGYLTVSGIENIKSTLAKDIFNQDLISVYSDQTKHRNELSASSRDTAADIIRQINERVYDNPKLEQLLVSLGERLKKHGGKKKYGYLKHDVKALVDAIVDEIAAEPKVAELYNLWYEKRFDVLRTYRKEMPDKLLLSQQTEFKMIKNIVIAEALNLNDGVFTFEDDIISYDDIPDEPVDIQTDADEPIIPDEYESLTTQAESGNKYAMYKLGKLYLDDQSERYDVKKAVHWLFEASKLEYEYARYKLGRLFLEGKHVRKEPAYGIQLLEQAADQNNQWAQYLLAKEYLSGENVPKDIGKAADFLSASAAQGYQWAKYKLARLLLSGNDLPIDIPKAVELLKEASRQDNAYAQYTLGKLLLKGETVPQDIPQAVELLEKAAEKNNQYAQYLLGKYHLEIKNTAAALFFLEQSASHDYPYALYTLGKMYLYGNGVGRDEEQAVRYLTASAEQGNPFATALLQSMSKKRNHSLFMGASRLLYFLSKLIADRADDRRGGIGMVEKKLRSKIDEKKAALGQRQD